MVDAIGAESVVCTHLVEQKRVSMRIKAEEAKHRKEHNVKGEEIGEIHFKYNMGWKTMRIANYISNPKELTKTNAC